MELHTLHRHGWSIAALPAARALIGLLSDDDVVGHVVKAVGVSRTREARSGVEWLLNHPKAWVRKEAKKAIVKLG